MCVAISRFAVLKLTARIRRPRKVKVGIYFTAVGMFTLPTEMKIQAAKDEIRQSPQQFKLSA